MGKWADMNGNKLLWVLVGLFISSAGFFGKWMWNLNADFAVVQEQVGGMAPKVADLHEHMKDESWRDYSAWQYQLQVNEALYAGLDIPRTLRAVPPKHLTETP